MYQVCYAPLKLDTEHKLTQSVTTKMVHYSTDSLETICGKEINQQWVTLTKDSTTDKVTCIKCLKQMKKRGIA